jgi:hypothetical protein
MRARPPWALGDHAPLPNLPDRIATVAQIAGHANTAVTGRVYAHEIEKAEHGDRAREAMERRRVKVGEASGS